MVHDKPPNFTCSLVAGVSRISVKVSPGWNRMTSTIKRFVLKGDSGGIQTLALSRFLSKGPQQEQSKYRLPESHCAALTQVRKAQDYSCSYDRVGTKVRISEMQICFSISLANRAGKFCAKNYGRWPELYWA